jgi:lysophospholipase L1-like esterase
MCLVWTLLAVAVLSVAAELAARARLRRVGSYYVWPPFARLHMTTDREGVPELEPVIRIEFNRDGERGGPPPEDARGTYRVLVAGGSVVECWFLDQASAWPQVIERSLNSAPSLARLGVSRVHVGNIGRSLVACEHVDRILERVLPRYERLDTIVLMVGASDLVHWLEKGTPARIDRDDIPLDALFSQHPEGPFGWTPHTLALRRVASAALRRIFRPVGHRKNAGRRISRARAARNRATEIIRSVPDPAPMLDRFEINLRSLIATAQKGAKRVLVARQPWLEKQFTPEEEKQLWMFGAGRLHAEAVHASYAHELVWGLMRKVDERVVSVARELGVDAIDLMPVVPPTFDLWYDEMHHTAAGCGRIGAALARAILDGA